MRKSSNPNAVRQRRRAHKTRLGQRLIQAAKEGREIVKDPNFATREAIKELDAGGGTRLSRDEAILKAWKS